MEGPHCPYYMPPTMRLSDAMSASYATGWFRPQPQQVRQNSQTEVQGNTASSPTAPASTTRLPPKYVIQPKRVAPLRTPLVEYARNNPLRPQDGNRNTPLPPKYVIQPRRVAPLRTPLVEYARNNPLRPQDGNRACKVGTTFRYYFLVEESLTVSWLGQWHFCDVIVGPQTSYDELLKRLQHLAVKILKKDKENKPSAKTCDVVGIVKVRSREDECVVTAENWHAWIRDAFRFADGNAQLVFEFVLEHQKSTGSRGTIKALKTAIKKLFSSRGKRDGDDESDRDDESELESERNEYRYEVADDLARGYLMSAAL